MNPVFQLLHSAMGLYKVPTVCGDDEKGALSYDVVVLLHKTLPLQGGQGFLSLQLEYLRLQTGNLKKNPEDKS